MGAAHRRSVDARAGTLIPKGGTQSGPPTSHIHHPGSLTERVRRALHLAPSVAHRTHTSRAHITRTHHTGVPTLRHAHRHPFAQNEDQHLRLDGTVHGAPPSPSPPPPVPGQGGLTNEPPCLLAGRPRTYRAARPAAAFRPACLLGMSWQQAGRSEPHPSSRAAASRGLPQRWAEDRSAA